MRNSQSNLKRLIVRRLERLQKHSQEKLDFFANGKSEEGYSLDIISTLNRNFKYPDNNFWNCRSEKDIENQRNEKEKQKTLYYRAQELIKLIQEIKNGH